MNLLGSFCQVESKDVTDQKINMRIMINQQDRIFEGHFPGQPVVPGVYLIQLTKEIISDTINKPLLLTTSKQIKFLLAIEPDNMKTLDILINYEHIDDHFIKSTCEISHKGQKCFKFLATYKIYS